MEIEVREIPVHYEQCGEGRPVVMFTGWALDGRFMAHHYEPIFEGRKGWRRIYPDMPGMGRTPAAAWITCQDDMLAVALEFVDAVAPGERPALIGASWGAYIALGMAHRRAGRLNGLMLVVPVVQPGRALRDLPEHVVLASDPEVTASLQPDELQWADFAVVQSRASLAAYRATIKPALVVADMPFLERVAEQYAFSFDARELTAQLEAPTLILAGRQDSACGYRDAWPLLERMPRATFAVLDRAGHDLEDVQRGIFEALTGEWLDRVEEYAVRLEPIVVTAR